MKIEFENILNGLGISYQSYPDGYYNLCHGNDVRHSIKVQFVCSEPVSDAIHGSHNGNQITAIIVFRFRLSLSGKEPDFFIFGFQNKTNQGLGHVIIPYNELKRRVNKRTQFKKGIKKFQIIFWLMPDNYLYDCTNLSTEGEWYFLSKSLDGRMSDGTDMDYSKFLNDWDRIKTA